MLGTKTRTFSDNVFWTAHVAAINETNLMLYGVLLTEDTEWLRICTTKIEDAEKIAFLSPDTYVGLKVRGNIPFQGTAYMKFHSLVLSG